MKKLILLSILLIVGCEGVLIPNDCAGVAGGDAVELWGICSNNTAENDYLYLPGSGLTGEIPPRIGTRTNLTGLDLYNNQLTGSIPPEIGNLTKLTELVLSNNQLTGEIPPEIGNLTNLEYLLLSANQLTGSIPSEIGNLTNLTGLLLFDNQLTGEIPSEVCDLIKNNNLQIHGILDGNNLTNTCE